MAELIAEHEERLRLAPENRRATFDDAVAAWLEYLEHELRVKPSTLRDYRYMFADPKAPQRRRGGKRERSGRIMKAFGGRELSSITTADLRHFLSTLDHADVSARTVNKFRATLHALFEYAMRSETYGLRVNPARDTKKRPEGGAKPTDTFEPAEVRSIAKAAREGLHRDRPDHNFSPETVAAWERSNEQDAAIIVVAAFAGLRLGELLALRWKDVDLADADRRLTVVRAVSAGQEVTSTKSRHFRVVPLSEQPAAELQRLSQRGHFTGRNDLVFCRKDGGPLDGSGVRQRFMAAQDAAGVRRRRFHDLRHTFGSLAVRSFDPVAVQSMMGHSSLLTTQRYLHSYAPMTLQADRSLRLARKAVPLVSPPHVVNGAGAVVRAGRWPRPSYRKVGRRCSLQGERVWGSSPSRASALCQGCSRCGVRATRPGVPRRVYNWNRPRSVVRTRGCTRDHGFRSAGRNLGPGS